MRREVSPIRSTTFLAEPNLAYVPVRLGGGGGGRAGSVVTKEVGKNREKARAARKARRRNRK